MLEVQKQKCYMAQMGHDKSAGYLVWVPLKKKKKVRNTVVLSRTIPVYICVSLRKITHLCANINYCLHLYFCAPTNVMWNLFKGILLLFCFFIFLQLLQKLICVTDREIPWWNWYCGKHGKLIWKSWIFLSCGLLRSGVQHKHCQKSCDSSWRS